MLPVVMLLAAAIIHGVLRNPGRTFADATHILIYYQGLWLAVSVTVVGVAQLVRPAAPTFGSIVVILIECCFVVLSVVHPYYIFRITHGSGFWRRTAAFVLAGVATIVTLVAGAQLLILTAHFGS